MSRNGLETLKPALEAYSGFVAATAELQRTQFDVAQTAVRTSWDIAESAGRLFDPAGILFRRRAVQEPGRAKQAAEALQGLRKLPKAEIVPDKEAADPIKHPELVAGEFGIAIPGEVGGNYPEKDYQRIRETAEKLPPGGFARFRRNYGDTHVDVDLYWRGLTPVPQREKVIKNKYSGETKLIIADERYVVNEEFREANRNDRFEEIVSFQYNALADPVDFEHRYYGPKHPTEEKQKQNLRNIGINRYPNPDAFLMLIRDPETQELIGLREGLRAKSDASLIEPAIIVAPKAGKRDLRHTGIATLSLHDTIGLLSTNGAIFEGSHHKDNKICKDAWDERVKRQLMGVSMIPGMVSHSFNPDEDIYDFKVIVPPNTQKLP